MGPIVPAAPVDDYLRQFQSLRTARIAYDQKWQYVSDYILPRRDFSITQRPGQLRPHRVTSSVATHANSRMAALVLAYWIDPTRPNLLPNVKRGLVAAGRPTDLDDVSLDYLDAMQWSVADHMMLERAQLMIRMGSMLKEFCAFGCGVIWTGRRRGFGPYFNTRPLQACWWSENEEGVIDTLYFRMMLPLYRVLRRWPNAYDLWRPSNGRNAFPDEQTMTPVLIACRPRANGRHGAVAEAKPFEYVTIAEEKGAHLEVSGYDSFPYSVFRYDPMPGEAYAEGPGCQVLPDVMVLNHLQQAIENVASQKAVPPIAVPARLFGKTLDRRPGAINAYNAAGLGLQRLDQAVMKLDFTGDLSGAVELKKSLIDDIELGYFVDWLRLRETGDMTAEEVSERRDMRLRGMSSIVANLGAPTCIMGDRVLEVMGAEHLLPPAPAAIAGAEVDWEYAGPLQVAQLRGNVQSILQLINARALVAKDDPGAAQAVDLETCLRALQQGLATPTGTMNSRQKVAEAKAALKQQQQQQQDAEKLATVAQAARDGGQGVSALAGAAQGAVPGPGGPAAPFAPAAPFSTPVAA